MNKKDLKWYESPVMETVNVKLEGFLCASNPDNPLDDSTAETEEME